MSTVASKFSCILLAGGQGRRVDGRDKGLIELNNKTLIEHSIDLINPQVNEMVISANRNIKTYQQFGHRVITDRNEHFQGPLAGLDAALSHCSHDWVFVTPCDMPFLPSDIVINLYKAVADCSLCIAKADDWLQPVFIMKKALHNTVTRFLANDQLKLMQWLKQQPHCVLNFPDADNFKNLNFSKDFL